MDTPKRVIIAGGTGLVGQTLTRRLVASGREVVLLTRDPNRRRPTPGVRLARWDGRTADGWGHLVDGAEAVFNLAGETIGGTNLAQIFLHRWTKAKKQRILESRVAAGQAILQAVRAAGRRPRRLIQMSAVGYYGPDDSPSLDESGAPGKDFLARVCQAWEASTDEAESLGVRRIVARTGLVLSLRGGLFPVILLPFRLFVGGKLGPGSQGFSWIHAEDQARALLHLLDDEGAGGAFNLTAPAPVSNAELGRTIGRVLRRPFWFPVPSFLLRLVLREKSTLVLDGQYVLPNALLGRGFAFHFPSLEAALRDLLGRKPPGGNGSSSEE